MCNTLSEKQSKTCNCMDGLRLMIKRQCAMFPKGQDFDFRCIFSGHNVDEMIAKYFDPELIDKLNKETTSDSNISSSKKHGNLYKSYEEVEAVQILF